MVQTQRDTPQNEHAQVAIEHAMRDRNTRLYEKHVGPDQRNPNDGEVDEVTFAWREKSQQQGNDAGDRDRPECNAHRETVDTLHAFDPRPGVGLHVHNPVR